MITTVIIAIVCFAVGGGLSYMLFRYGLKSKYDIIIKEAQTEAEVIKKNKLLEVKEKFLNKKADLEKEVALRNQKIQQAENKLKQRELMLNQKQEEVQRKRTEAEAIKENLEAQIVIIDKKKDELDKLQMQEREKLEALSGLSAEEAKERLIESLKEEAKTQAASYINDIMDDAKLTANKEAKRIVIQSIQRVATETAIENSITVFHIESDEIKGRIIGREGRNIRALEAATGVETRATILGYMQRGGSPTCKDRYYASIMGCLAADILCEGKTNRVVGYRHGEFRDFDIEEALAMQKDIPEYEYKISKLLAV